MPGGCVLYQGRGCLAESNYGIPLTRDVAVEPKIA